MSRRAASIEPGWFDALYANDPDPWRFASSDYEREKYAASLAALPPRRFQSGLEVGCSIGVFTRALAARCDRLLAIDVAAAALDRARATCTADHVTFAERRVPEAWPDGVFDLIVLSEVLYYLDAADLDRVAMQARSALAPGGCVLLVHFLGETDYPLTGDEAASAFIATAALPVQRSERAPRYRLDVLEDMRPVSTR
jgi:predicted TPR repeat methyltransferase